MISGEDGLTLSLGEPQGPAAAVQGEAPAALGALWAL